MRMIDAPCWWCKKDTPHKYDGLSKHGKPMYDCTICHQAGFSINVDKCPQSVMDDLYENGYTPPKPKLKLTQLTLQEFIE